MYWMDHAEFPRSQNDFSFFLCNNNFYSKKADHFKNPPIKKEIQGNLHHTSKYITRLSERGGVGDYNYVPAFGSSVKVNIQGVSEWTDISKLALRGRSIINLLELWCIVSSGGLEICESSNSFQKNYIGWPLQPPTKKVLKFNMIFHDSRGWVKKKYTNGFKSGGNS